MYWVFKEARNSCIWLGKPTYSWGLTLRWIWEKRSAFVWAGHNSSCRGIKSFYLLTANGLPPGGSSTVHIYTQTIHRATQKKQYIEQRKNFGIVRAVPRLCELYPGICLTTEEKVRKKPQSG